MRLDYAYTHEELEEVDEDITYILNKIRKKIEGQKRSIPYFNKKMRRNTVMQYWKVRIKEKQGKIINRRAILNCKQYIETEIEVLIE